MHKSDWISAGAILQASFAGNRRFCHARSVPPNSGNTDQKHDAPSCRYLCNLSYLRVDIVVSCSQVLPRMVFKERRDANSCLPSCPHLSNLSYLGVDIVVSRSLVFQHMFSEESSKGLLSFNEWIQARNRSAPPHPWLCNISYLEVEIVVSCIFVHRTALK